MVVGATRRLRYCGPVTRLCVPGARDGSAVQQRARWLGLTDLRRVCVRKTCGKKTGRCPLQRCFELTREISTWVSACCSPNSRHGLIPDRLTDTSVDLSVWLRQLLPRDQPAPLNDRLLERPLDPHLSNQSAQLLPEDLGPGWCRNAPAIHRSDGSATAASSSELGWALRQTESCDHFSADSCYHVRFVDVVGDHEVRPRSHEERLPLVRMSVHGRRL